MLVFFNKELKTSFLSYYYQQIHAMNFSASFYEVKRAEKAENWVKLFLESYFSFLILEVKSSKKWAEMKFLKLCGELKYDSFLIFLA